MSGVSISAFFPCYNDAGTIGGLVLETDAVLRSMARDYEIIVVDDGSRDGSAEILAALRARVGRLLVVTHPVNRGYGAALRSGFAAATKELIFYTDGDGQYDVQEIPLLVMLLSDDVDFVNGIKMTRGDPPYRVFAGNLHKFLMRWFLWLPVIDVDCDFRLIRRPIIDRIRLTSRSGSICAELVKRSERAGARFREVSVHHYPRRFGASQFFTSARIVRTYLDVAVLFVEMMVLDRLKGAPRGRRERKVLARGGSAGPPEFQRELIEGTRAMRGIEIAPPDAER